MKYTVVGFHDEDSHKFCEHVVADSVNEAAMEAAKSAAKSLDKHGIDVGYSIKNIVIVEMFKGHLEPLIECSDTQCVE